MHELCSKAPTYGSDIAEQRADRHKRENIVQQITLQALPARQGRAWPQTLLVGKLECSFGKRLRHVGDKVLQKQFELWATALQHELEGGL